MRSLQIEKNFNVPAERQRIGNPPGKKIDSLGDQISWEQLLTYCKAKGKPKLWIITRDSDYATAYDKRLYLNAFLYSELAQVFNVGPEVFCFDNIPDAVKHFSETERIKADKLPTPEETKQIKEEQASLPRVDWLKGYDDGGFSVILKHYPTNFGILPRGIKKHVCV